MQIGAGGKRKKHGEKNVATHGGSREKLPLWMRFKIRWGISKEEVERKLLEISRRALDADHGEKRGCWE